MQIIMPIFKPCFTITSSDLSFNELLKSDPLLTLIKFECLLAIDGFNKGFHLFKHYSNFNHFIYLHYNQRQ